MTRIESASSINTFKTCERKYFYHYKLGLPSKESIPTINGKAVHTALEQFFKINPERLSFDNYENELKHHLLSSFNSAWAEAVPSLINLEQDKELIKKYYEDSVYMLERFADKFLFRLKQTMNGKNIVEAFNAVKPDTEVAISSQTHKVRGFIDAIHKNNGEVLILDYKTSRSDELTEEYKLQLAIYGLLFQESYGRPPDRVGLYFLRHGVEKFVPVNEELINFAIKECKYVHENSASEQIEDYPKNLGPACKWCDYKQMCFGQKTLMEYQQVKEEQ